MSDKVWLAAAIILGGVLFSAYFHHPTSTPEIPPPTAEELAKYQAAIDADKAACAQGFENRCHDPYNPNAQPSEDYDQFMKHAYKALDDQ